MMLNQHKFYVQSPDKALLLAVKKSNLQLCKVLIGIAVRVHAAFYIAFACACTHFHQLLQRSSKQIPTRCVRKATPHFTGVSTYHDTVF